MAIRSLPFIPIPPMPLQTTLTLPTSQTFAPTGACSSHHEGRRSVIPGRKPSVRACTSIIRDPTIHWKLFNLVLSTVLFLINLAIFITFVVLRAIQGPWIYIILTFILLTIGVVWCHALCRLVAAVYQFPNYAADCTLPIEMTETASYVRPNHPISVTLAGDEERSTGSHSTGHAVKVTTPPPAYGLWRDSVLLIYIQRLDPCLLHWQCLENQPAALQHTERRNENPNREPQGHRPPSYMSDNSVEGAMGQEHWLNKAPTIRCNRANVNNVSWGGGESR
ncbi:uncharacterized protein ANIA_11182 [Aspergillus nidulans FGSC A4]|uniref:Uncharacterized protein n=1 Tax=Emericella nidulans (strain FGSC A4 / ATCC 38163 / CBS 112.46 / NRRL 194 / M139) TaxID=227321 RepID=C8VH62_EMENI|nr:hypothetical protein [Aspergillus nidulans FGSC A4]CBF82582.1 TPA: conserved hypothetical protein [Aspergillus nidulans FGSC A4]